MEVEAAGDAVDVEDFAGEVEAGVGFAIHGFEVEILEVDAAAGDEFVFVGGLARDREGAGGELGEEGVGLLFAQVGVGEGFWDFRSEAKIRPETLREISDGGTFVNLARGVSFFF